MVRLPPPTLTMLLVAEMVTFPWAVIVTPLPGLLSEPPVPEKRKVPATVKLSARVTEEGGPPPEGLSVRLLKVVPPEVSVLAALPLVLIETVPLLWVKVPLLVKASLKVRVPEVEVKVPALVRAPVTFTAPAVPVKVAPELLANVLLKVQVATAFEVPLKVPLLVKAPVTVRALEAIARASPALMVSVLPKLSAVVAVTVLLVPATVTTLVPLNVPEDWVRLSLAPWKFSLEA